jgi:hypothetical protein
MGIRKGTVTHFGLNAENAYHRIKTVRGENGGVIKYEVETYLDQDARLNGFRPLTSDIFAVPGDLQSRLGIISELYNILKLEPGYEGAEDIFEPTSFPHISGQISNAYMLMATSISGLDTDTMSVNDGYVTGKFVMNGYVVQGTLASASISNIASFGDGYRNGYISEAELDGYIVQVL